MAVEKIIFDCMETLVDMQVLPQFSDYARWGYEGSLAESYWPDFKSFLQQYEEGVRYWQKELQPNEEYEMSKRFQYCVGKQLPGISSSFAQEITSKLMKGFWQNYSGSCYVRQEVKDVLQELSKRYPLGVVSNFMVSRGIEALLKKYEIKEYFDFVVTSIDFGWRKPDVRIYDHVRENSFCSAQNLVFVGDDYENDYLKPRELGWQAVFLDRENKAEAAKRIRSFVQLPEIIAELDR